MSDAPSTLPLRAWVEAWEDAITPSTHTCAAQHFRTSIDAGTAIARRIAALLAPHLSTRALRPTIRCLRCIVDIGSSSGALLTQLAALVDDEVTLIGVDVRPRPDDLPATNQWRQVRVTHDVEDITGRDGRITGLVIAHEFLDDVACPVIELDDDLRPRIVQDEAATGAEARVQTSQTPPTEALLGGISPGEARAWWSAGGRQRNRWHVVRSASHVISCGAALPGYSPAATQSPSTTPIDSMIGARDCGRWND